MKENLPVATVTGVGPLEQERRLCAVSPGVATPWRCSRVPSLTTPRSHSRV